MNENKRKSRWTEEAILKKIGEAMQYIGIAIYRILCWLLERLLRFAIRALDGLLDGLTRVISRCILGGILVNLIGYFYPEFSTRFPTIYGWFDGWLQFGEFAFKVAIQSIYSLFNGNCFEFWAECKEAYLELSQQFVNWISTIKF